MDLPNTSVAPSQAETEVDPAAYVAAIDARARRVETPCGDGVLVWRIWGEGEPLLISHGAQGSWTHWIDIIDALSAKRMLIAVDLPGHGDSAMPPSSDHDSISAVLAEGLAQVLGEVRPIDLAGFSFGGVTFAHFAAFHPEFVRRLILVGTGGLDTPLGHIDLRRISGLNGEERKAAIRGNLLGLMLDHEESADDLAQYLAVTNARNARLRNASELVLPDKLALILPRVTQRVDAIWGEHDRPHPNPAAQEAVLRCTHPHADFRVIAESGHWVMYERPSCFNTALLELLERQVA